jgi:hypothetical protein
LLGQLSPPFAILVFGLAFVSLAHDASEDDLAAAGDFDLDLIDPLLARDIDRTRQGSLGELRSTSP